MYHSNTSSCRICGKTLTAPVSVELGIGPVCRVEVKNRIKDEKTLNMFANRSEYDYDIQGSVIAITDLGGMKSVTNDIENVLDDIRIERNIDLSKFKIMYKDSQGIWDGVTPTNPVSFFPLNERDFSKAKDKLLSGKSVNGNCK